MNRFTELLLAVSCLVMLTTASIARSQETIRFYLGCHTKPDGNQGIYHATLDLKTGAMTEPTLAGKVSSPLFVAMHPTLPVLYSVAETVDAQGKKTGGVVAMGIEQDGSLKQLSAKPSEGANACYVSVDPNGKFVMVANYSGGNVAAFPLGSDGSISGDATVHKHEGSGPNPKRQQRAFAHSIVPSPDGRFALSADLGADRVYVYDIQKTLELKSTVSLEAGAGPRHIVFHPTQPRVYVINELNNTITSFAWDAVAGELKTLASVPTLPADFKGENTCAEVTIHPNGKFLYGSNRGHDSIAIFSIAEDGSLKSLGHTPTGGKHPRHFAIDPTGAFLLAANRDTDNVVSFRIDQNTGALTPTGHESKLDAPACVRFTR